MKPLPKWTRLDKVIERWSNLSFRPDLEELSQYIRYDDLRLYAKGLGFVEKEFIQVIFENYKEGSMLGWKESFLKTVYKKLEFNDCAYEPITLKIDIEQDPRDGAKQRQYPLAVHSFDTETEINSVALLARPFDGKITKEVISDALIELADFYNKGLTEKYSFTPILDERQLYLERYNLMQFEQQYLNIPHNLENKSKATSQPSCLDESSDYYAPLIQLAIELHQALVVDKWHPVGIRLEHTDLVYAWIEKEYNQIISDKVKDVLAQMVNPDGKANQKLKK